MENWKIGKLKLHRLIVQAIWLVSFFIFGCSSSVSTLPSPAASPTPSLLDIWADAEAHLAEQQYSEASATLETGLTIYPEHPDILIPLGQIYLIQQQWYLAEDVFNRALAQNIEDVRAIAGLAELAAGRGDHLKALPQWQRAVNLDPTVANGFTGLGLTHLTLLNFEAAQQAFEQQQARAPTFEAGWHLSALLAPADLAAAQTELESLPAIDPDISEAEQALLQARQAYLTETLAAFDATASSAEVAKTVGLALAQIEQWPLAINALQIANEATPNDAEVLTFLAHTLAQADQPAFDLFEAAKQADPTSPLPLYFQATYLSQQGAYQAAEDILEEASDLDPENAAVYMLWGNIREAQGDLPTAEAFYAAAVEVSDQDLEFALLMLTFYTNYSYRLNEVGIPFAEYLLEQYPDNAKIHDALGWMQFLAGSPDNGEEMLREAIKLEPNLISAHYHLGRLFESRDQSALAEIEYRTVIDLDHTNQYRPLAMEALQRIRTQ